MACRWSAFRTRASRSGISTRSNATDSAANCRRDASASRRSERRCALSSTIRAFARTRRRSRRACSRTTASAKLRASSRRWRSRPKQVVRASKASPHSIGNATVIGHKSNDHATPGSRAVCLRPRSRGRFSGTRQNQHGYEDPGMSLRMVVRELHFAVCAGVALSALAGVGPIAARAASPASLPSIVHSPADSALSSSSARAIARLVAPDGWMSDGSIWSGQKVVIDDGAQGDFFGWSVAIDGQTALVGAYGTTVNGQEQQGAVYVFTESNGIWTQTAKLIADDGRRFDIFGSAVALSGDVAAIGAYQSNLSVGAVYVFTGSGSLWSQKAKLTADDGVRGDCLGWSVAVSPAGVLAGAPFAVVDGIEVGAV